MSIDWRLKVYDETFVARSQPPAFVTNIITSDMGVASLDGFDVDAAGNCLEASFRALPDFVDIRPRDIIILEISTDSGSTWTAKYRGYVVTCGNPRSKRIQPYKLVGLKQRFYEKVVQAEVIDSDDVGTMANDIFDDLVAESDLPSGVTSSGEDIPLLTFELGNRYPRFELAGQAFDSLAETVGAFVVPSGDTYTYDGVTYTAGQTVPAVIWGVRADGEFFFARPQASSLAISELDSQTFVQFNQINGETVADKVALVYASELQPGPLGDFTYERIGTSPGIATRGVEPVPQPIVRIFDIGSGDDSTTVVTALDPVGLLTGISSFHDSFGTVSNASNVADGDDNTYATVTNGRVAVEADTSIYDEDVDNGYFVRVRFMPTSSTHSISVVSPYYEIFTTLQIARYNAATDLRVNGIYDVYLPFMRGLNTFDPSGGAAEVWKIRDTVTVDGVNVRVYSLEILVPDVDDGGTLSEEYANGFVRQPSLDVATIRRVDTLGAVTQTVSFTPDGESARDVPVERIEYALTTRNGLTTTYHLGQAYDAELLSERAVLETLARRATR